MTEARFSDSELMELRKRFEAHAQRFDNHVVRFDRHVEEGSAHWAELARMVHANTEATQRIAAAVENEARQTAGIVKLYRDAQGTLRTGRGLTRFTLWLASLGAAGAAIAAAVNWIADRI